jgi:DNA-binding response OmpR family regulator
MDLRLLVLTGDRALSELLAAQAENLGCQCTIHSTYDEAASNISWADAAIIDLADDGVDDLNRLRVEAPRVRILALAAAAAHIEAARAAGAHQVIEEPFAIADLVTALRALAPGGDAEVIDLRTKAVSRAPVVEDAPWFSTH